MPQSETSQNTQGQIAARILTMILAIAPNTQSTCFDCGKTQPYGLTQSCRIDVWDLILLTNPAVGEIEALSRHIAIGICRIIGAKP